MNKWLILHLIALFLPGFLWAQEPGQSVTETLQSLRAEGISKIGDFDVNQFAKQTRQIKWEKVPEIDIQAPAKERLTLVGQDIFGNLQTRTIERIPPEKIQPPRKSGHYEAGDKIVEISSQIPTEYEDQLPQLELHEALGATHYNDKHYALSTAIETLLNTDDPKVRQKLRAAYAKTLFQKENLYADGGASVGGGGDALSLLIKNSLLEKILDDHPNVDPNFYVTYAQIGFEPFPDQPDRQFVGLEYELRLPVGISHLGHIDGIQKDLVLDHQHVQEILIFHFPPRFWQENPDQLLAYLEAEILGIYPIQGEPVKTYQFTVNKCGQSYVRTAPLGNDACVVSIQRVRAEELIDCVEPDPLVELVQTGGVNNRCPGW